jgi:hypothetical protein
MQVQLTTDARQVELMNQQLTQAVIQRRGCSTDFSDAVCSAATLYRCPANLYTLSHLYFAATLTNLLHFQPAQNRRQRLNDLP